MTHRYGIYGAGLASSIAFPELGEATEPGWSAKWSFHTTPQLPIARDVMELGAERIYGDVHARLARHADGHRITVDDTGVFDIDADGRQLRWQERAESWPDFMRAHLMGRVLATTMFNDGWLPLHGSAVALAHGVVAFLAPKGFGKSTLALALTTAGARLVTDDTLPVEPAGGANEVPFGWPGVHSMRVREDSVLALGVESAGQETREGKRLLTAIPSARRQNVRLPLAAVYLLDPVSGDSPASAPLRTAMPPLIASMGIVAHVKIGAMLGSSAASAMLERATGIAAQVPVHRLHVPRDLSLLPAFAIRLIECHGGVS